MNEQALRSFGLAALPLSVFVISTACSPTGEPSAAPPEVPSHVLEGGSSVYFGNVYPLNESADQPTFVYERRVDVRAGEMVSSHLTREPDGDLVLAESATHTDHYELSRYELHGNQLGQRGHIEVRGGQVRYQLIDAQGAHDEVESVDQPVVVGPTLVGYIVEHLPALRSGETLSVRFALLDRMETLGFDLEVEDAPPGMVGVRMTPSSFLVSLAVDPIHYVFEEGTSKLVRLEGRVPPKRRRGAALEDFDARVEYSFVSSSYR